MNLLLMRAIELAKRNSVYMSQGNNIVREGLIRIDDILNMKKAHSHGTTDQEHATS